MRRAIIPLGFGLMVLAACSGFPDLDVAQANPGAKSTFPILIPIGPLLTAAANDTGNAGAQVATLARRVSLLRARARALQRPVISRRDRARLLAAVAGRTR